MQPEALQEQFGTREQQRHAAQFGMWIFLATEVLLFAGLFVGYAVYRVVYSEAFKEAAEHMDAYLGAAMTLILVTSSFLVAWSIHCIREDRTFRSALSVGLAILLGAIFLALKLHEWGHHAAEGALPGEWYHFEKVPQRGGSLFFTLYFLMTGLHALHVTVGLGVLGWVGFNTLAGRYSREYHTPLEAAGMFWHLVDVFWIFLFPLLYLLR